MKYSIRISYITAKRLKLYEVYEPTAKENHQTKFISYDPDEAIEIMIKLNNEESIEGCY